MVAIVGTVKSTCSQRTPIGLSLAVGSSLVMLNVPDVHAIDSCEAHFTSGRTTPSFCPSRFFFEKRQQTALRSKTEETKTPASLYLRMVLSLRIKD